MSLAAGLVLAACTDEPAGVAEAPADGTVVTTTEGAPGTFLTDADGMTLYLFTNDTPGASTCSGDCLATWPALLTVDAPVAGSGVDAALLGTKTREDGSLQVTYSGWPLYFFAGDVAPGDVAGQGLNGVWFMVSPTGEQLAMTPDVDGDSDTGMSGYGPSNDYDYDY